MNRFDDYEDEMSNEFERFSEGVRAAATRMPTPSPALAHMLAHGISSPTQKKRSIFMRAKAYVAGLGVAAKVMLGAGVAVAATGGAAAVVEATHPDEHHEVAIVADTTTTTVHHEERTHDEPHTTTTVMSDEPRVEEPHTTTTVRHDEPRPRVEEPHTTTTVRHDEPRHDEPTTTTTTRVEEPTNPESIVLTCEAKREPNRVVCSWTGSDNPEHRRYKLLRTNADFSDGRVMYSTEDHREYVDTTTLGDHTYFYRVVSLREDGTTESHSNGVMISCC
jgi:hypothetical protein